MKIFNYIAFLLLIGFIGTAIYIAVQPNEFTVTSSRVINAPAAVLFKKVNDLKNWPEFTPWMEEELNTHFTYGEATVGVGANFGWDGPVLGEGSIKTLAVNDNQFISQQISLKTPFKSESTIQWDFEPTEEGTKVTWSMKGEQDFMTKMYTVFSGSIEENTAQDFERGLLKLEQAVIADMEKYTITVNGITDHSGGYYLYNTTSTKIENVASSISSMLRKIFNYTQENNIAMEGAPFISYMTWDEKNNAAIFSICVPITDEVITTDSDILTGELSTFKAVKTTLKGHYSHLKEAWDAARDYIPTNGLALADDDIMLGVYITDPRKYPNPADWVTEIYIAIK